jgi:hypothetical protein
MKFKDFPLNAAYVKYFKDGKFLRYTWPVRPDFGQLTGAWLNRLSVMSCIL